MAKTTEALSQNTNSTFDLVPVRGKNNCLKMNAWGEEHKKPEINSPTRRPPY